MANLTIGSVVSKISETRSKIAVYEMLLLHLSGNYSSSDHGPAEMTVLREDYATVSEADLAKTVEDIKATVEMHRAELAAWEGMTVSSPQDDSERSTKKARRERLARDRG